VLQKNQTTLVCLIRIQLLGILSPVHTGWFYLDNDAVEWLTFLLRIGEALASNLDSESSFSEVIIWFFQSVQANAGIMY
jgi:hypothetical protein